MYHRSVRANFLAPSLDTVGSVRTGVPTAPRRRSTWPGLPPAPTFAMCGGRLVLLKLRGEPSKPCPAVAFAPTSTAGGRRGTRYV